MENEAELQKAVCEYLDCRGVIWYHIPRQLAQKRKQLADIPDLMCLGWSGIFFIELKNPTKKKMFISGGQRNFMNVCIKNKIPCVVSNNYDDIIAFIKGNMI